ncbi:MAG: YwqG family protein [Bacteroidota bacterium]
MSIFKKLFGKKKEEVSYQKSKNSIQPKNSKSELEEALKTITNFKRTAYIPQVKVVKPTFNTKSKIGGLPYLRSKEDWPVCPNCQNQMTLFLQLNLAELPEHPSDGLIQLFYCTNKDPMCESDMDAYLPFSKSVVCRKIDVSGKSAIIKPTGIDIFEEKEIVNWEPKDDYPHFEEYYNLGIETEITDELYDLLEEANIGPLTGEKLFGWPHWIQGKENPSDRNTSTEMELLFQLDSEINLPYMFGDMGIGHLTQSPDNSEELAFGWACS